MEEHADDFEGVTLHEPRTQRKYHESPSWGDSPTLKSVDIGSDWAVDDSSVNDRSVFG